MTALPVLISSNLGLPKPNKNKSYRIMGRNRCETAPRLRLPAAVSIVLARWGVGAPPLSHGCRSTIWMKQGTLRSAKRSSGPPDVVAKKELRRSAESSS